MSFSGANINGAGKFEIDFGTVQFSSGGSATWDELDSAGLTFGNANATNLTFVSFNGAATGTVTVQGPVTMAANTTTTMNFTGANGNTPNSTDQLNVQGGTLTLAGKLFLNSLNGSKLTRPGFFFQDTFANAAITDNFQNGAITDSLHKVDTGAVVPVNQNQVLYTVTMQ